jgi:hypothetical protein
MKALHSAHQSRSLAAFEELAQQKAWIGIEKSILE